MPDVHSPSHQQFRVVRRPVCRATPSLHIRPVRASLLDRRLAGDHWIADEGNGVGTLYLGEFCVAFVLGTPLDLPSFNQLLDRIRHQRPRRRRGH